MSATVKTDREQATARPEGYPERVPDFATEEEEREFWDTHDTTYYLEGAEDVTHNPPPELGRGPGRAGSRARKRPDAEHMELVQLLMPEDTVAALQKLAAQRRQSYHALINAWVAERLAQEQGAPEPQ
jgi:hypothetical protein